MLIPRAPLIFAFALCLPSLAHAWGDRGHKVVAEIAVAHLSQGAKEQIQGLIGDGRRPPREAAIWSDQIGHDRPKTWLWHQIDVPYEAGVFDPTGRCPNDDCILPKIDEFARKLGDRELPVDERVEALKWLIHLIGDLHQPLHAISDGDDWGNEVWVRVGEATIRLHVLWDIGLVNALGSSTREIAAKIIAQITDDDLQQWRAGTPYDWAGESYAIGHDFIYPQSRGVNTPKTAIVLPDSYIADATPLVTRRLAMAGVRLAWMIEQLLP